MTLFESIQQLIEAKVAEFGVKIGDRLNFKQLSTLSTNNGAKDTLLSLYPPDRIVEVSSIHLNNSSTLPCPEKGTIYIAGRTINKDGTPSKNQIYLACINIG